MPRGKALIALRHLLLAKLAPSHASPDSPPGRPMTAPGPADEKSRNGEVCGSSREVFGCARRKRGGLAARRAAAEPIAAPRANREDLRNQTHAAPPADAQGEDDDEDARPRLIIEHGFSARKRTTWRSTPENPQAPSSTRTRAARLPYDARARRGREPRRCFPSSVVFSGRKSRPVEVRDAAGRKRVLKVSGTGPSAPAEPRRGRLDYRIGRFIESATALVGSPGAARRGRLPAITPGYSSCRRSASPSPPSVVILCASELAVGGVAPLNYSPAESRLCWRRQQPEFSRTHGRARTGRPGPPQRRGGPAPRGFVEPAAGRAAGRVGGEHDADSRSRVRLRNARQVPHAPHPAVAGGGRGRDAGPDAGVDAARHAGVWPKPRARVGVAASVAATVQPLPAARAVRDGRADGCSAAAAASGLTSPMTLCVPARARTSSPLTRPSPYA